MTIKYILIASLALQSLTGRSQSELVIGSGTSLVLGNNTVLTLHQVTLNNNGTMNSNTSHKLLFTGSQTAQIKGSGTNSFHNLEIALSGAAKLELQSDIEVLNELKLSSGIVDLGAQTIEMASGALVQGENESNRIISSGAGYVEIQVNLNAPNQVNPGNLGAVITSSANLGNTTIRRGHGVSSIDADGSIKRYFDVLPANNTNLAATFRFNYLESELNGLTESNLALGRSVDHVAWTNVGYTTRSSASNYIEKTGIPSFSRWTAFAESVLPVKLAYFGGRRGESGAIHLEWRTDLEENASHFDVLQSFDAVNFRKVGTQTAHQSSSGTATYRFTDAELTGRTVYYRLKAVDLDGTFDYSNIISIRGFEVAATRFYPNPVRDRLVIASETSAAKLRVYDYRGLEVDVPAPVKGENGNYRVDMGRLPSGVYLVQWNETTQKVVKD